MKSKTSELTGIALDWAVAKCEGMKYSCIDVFLNDYEVMSCLKYSSDWSQGGPIIEMEGIWLGMHSNDEHGAWYPMHETYYGTTYLEAAMRCYVASNLGEEVDVPEELSS